jgi:HD-GYP domain-containing protein (c-di-GMP phosphodiesterase class II)
MQVPFLFIFILKKRGFMKTLFITIVIILLLPLRATGNSDDSEKNHMEILPHQKFINDLEYLNRKYKGQTRNDEYKSRLVSLFHAEGSRLYSMGKVDKAQIMYSKALELNKKNISLKENVTALKEITEFMKEHQQGSEDSAVIFIAIIGFSLLLSGFLLWFLANYFNLQLLSGVNGVLKKVPPKSRNNPGMDIIIESCICMDDAEDIEVDSSDIDGLLISEKFLEDAKSNSQSLFSIEAALDLAWEADIMNNRAGHSERIALHAKECAKAAGDSHLSPEDAFLAGLLHDYSLRDYPWDVVMEEKEAFDHIHDSYQFTFIQERYDIVKSHPQRTVELLKPYSLSPVILQGILYHHERIDGSGYPFGISGNKIPLLSQILSICEYYDYLLLQISGYNVKTIACEILFRHGQYQFDKELIRIMISVIESIENKKRKQPSSLDSYGGFVTYHV